MPDNLGQPRQVWETRTEGTRVRRGIRIGWEEHMWKLMKKKGKTLQGRPDWLRTRTSDLPKARIQTNINNI